MNQDTGKLKFLKVNRVHNEPEAMQNAFQAALRRSGTYAANAVDRDAEKIRTRWAELLRAVSDQYGTQVSDDTHVRNISHVCDILSREFARILDRRRFRIGVSQKALNVYLKYLWCLGLLKVPPPHCPIDSTVLQTVGIGDAWTQLDSAEKYMGWISTLREVTGRNEYGGLQEWELELWNEGK